MAGGNARMISGKDCLQVSAKLVHACSGSPFCENTGESKGVGKKEMTLLT